MTPRERSSPMWASGAYAPSSARNKKRLAVDSPTWRRSVRSSPPGDISHSSRHAITRSKPPPPRDATLRRYGAQRATFQAAFLEGYIIRLGISLSTIVDISWPADSLADSRKSRENI